MSNNLLTAASTSVYGCKDVYLCKMEGVSVNTHPFTVVFPRVCFTELIIFTATFNCRPQKSSVCPRGSSAGLLRFPWELRNDWNTTETRNTCAMKRRLIVPHVRRAEPSSAVGVGGCQRATGAGARKSGRRAIEADTRVLIVPSITVTDRVWGNSRCGSLIYLVSMEVSGTFWPTNDQNHSGLCQSSAWASTSLWWSPEFLSTWSIFVRT